jgi:hypothetical protein
MKSEEEIFKEHMSKIPFPEHLASSLSPAAYQLFKENWSGDIEKCIENVEKALGIKTHVNSENGGTFATVTMREPND